MATVGPHGKGWRAQIRRLGFPALSRTFPTKSAAWAWAHGAERDLLAGQFHISKKTVADALERYRREVSPGKGGARWEDMRLKAFLRHPVAARALARLTADEMGHWRDDRLHGAYGKPVSGSTVRREMNLWDSVLEVARRTWKWIPENPVKDVQKPAPPRSRRRRVLDAETEKICGRLTGPAGIDVAAGFRLGIESGMRAGEMWTLGREQIDLDRGVARLLKTKNGDQRDVALSPAAIAIMRALLEDGRPMLMRSTNTTRDVLFRRARDAAGIINLHFHDSRTEAIFRLSKKPRAARSQSASRR